MRSEIMETLNFHKKKNRKKNKKKNMSQRLFLTQVDILNFNLRKFNDSSSKRVYKMKTYPVDIYRKTTAVHLTLP